MKILNRFTKEIIFKSKHKTIKQTTISAVKKGADLWGADLREANLQGADLWGADLQGADLWGADLREANLQGADLRKADLCNANFHKAKISYRAKVVEVNFTEVESEE